MENNLANEVKELWVVYVWWSCVLILKMNALTWFTGRIRATRRVIHSEEDKMWLASTDIILCPTGGGHEDVVRIRNAHQHDLGIVIPYLLIAPIWLTTSPLFPMARLILPAFAVVSILRTLLHIKFVDLHRYCITILSISELCILIYMSVVSAFYYAS
ncbi:uncharacterized protein LOC100742467 [Bombus impatiens]|uniref:Uncharacterized protein LOC100742467 n=1 Tax=Bombus impatiens TaxID=132113 RepID=A0A6P3UQ04_BOMIM|nr:uncharacterized protein LOC100742467 [Bombus impatiens]XP_033175668.1 uncharacterized protein LOC100742467 [Bombus impatiens]XP_050482657.1 uncharacterized protein LOC126869760 [Bombus huntii]